MLRVDSNIISHAPRRPVVAQHGGKFCGNKRRACFVPNNRAEPAHSQQAQRHGAQSRQRRVVHAPTDLPPRLPTARRGNQSRGRHAPAHDSGTTRPRSGSRQISRRAIELGAFGPGQYRRPAARHRGASHQSQYRLRRLGGRRCVEIDEWRRHLGVDDERFDHVEYFGAGDEAG
ncbi:MAG: hypothetical protein ALAOOOJD_00951 [bacterium]|nr:hypothetical protein [bacterium]